MDAFLDLVRRAVRPGGRVYVIDEPAGGWQVSGPSHNNHWQTRTVADGETFQIVKVYYHPEAIADQLHRRGFRALSVHQGNAFFSLTGVRACS